MKYGYFDDINREYVITDPATPLPWINYLGCRDFFSLISNTCGGYWGWNTATPIMRLHGWMMKMTRKACTPCC